MNWPPWLARLIGVTPAPAQPALLPKPTISAASMQRATEAAGGVKAKQHPFRIAEPPPGVLPKDTKPLAMDECLPDTLNWAASSIFSGYEEGLVFPGYAYLAELAQRPEYRRASERIATEMTRKWIELQSAGSADDDALELDEKAERAKAKSEKIRKIGEELIRLNVRAAFREAAQQDGFFGRSHLFVDLGDVSDEELKKPIGNGADAVTRNKIAKGSLKALRPVEAMWAYPAQYNSINPLKGDWYKPSTWFVMGKEVHASRLLTFIGRDVPDLLKPAYAFGGLSLSQMGKPYVDNWLRTRQAVSDLIPAFSVSGLKTNMSTVLQPGGGDGSSLRARVDLFNAYRSNLGAMMLDKDTEEFFNITTPLGTLDNLQAQSQEHMAAVWGIPLVIFLGIQPAGLNASSEGEIRVFYDWVESYQELLFRENLTRVVNFIQISLYGEVDPTITIKFVPLWSLDEKSEADKRKTEADTDAVYIDAGVLDQREVRKRLADDPASQYHGLNADDVPGPSSEELEQLGKAAAGFGKGEESEPAESGTQFQRAA